MKKTINESPSVNSDDESRKEVKVNREKLNKSLADKSEIIKGNKKISK